MSDTILETVGIELVILKSVYFLYDNAFKSYI